MPKTKTAKPTKPRLGRPPLPPGAARVATLKARVTDATIDEVATAARAEGVDPSEIVRRAVAAYLVARKMPRGQ